MKIILPKGVTYRAYERKMIIVVYFFYGQGQGSGLLRGYQVAGALQILEVKEGMEIVDCSLNNLTVEKVCNEIKEREEKRLTGSGSVEDEQDVAIFIEKFPDVAEMKMMKNAGIKIMGDIVDWKPKGGRLALLKSFDRVICVNNRMREECISKKYGCQADRVVVIPHHWDDRFLRNERRTELAMSSEPNERGTMLEMSSEPDDKEKFDVVFNGNRGKKWVNVEFLDELLRKGLIRVVGEPSKIKGILKPLRPINDNGEIHPKLKGIQCHYSVRKTGTPCEMFKSGIKLLTAGCLGANIIISGDCSNIEMFTLAGLNIRYYPYYVGRGGEITLKRVMSVIAKAKKDWEEWRIGESEEGDWIKGLEMLEKCVKVGKLRKGLDQSWIKMIKGVVE